MLTKHVARDTMHKHMRKIGIMAEDGRAKSAPTIEHRCSNTSRLAITIWVHYVGIDKVLVFKSGHSLEIFILIFSDIGFQMCISSRFAFTQPYGRAPAIPAAANPEERVDNYVCTILQITSSFEDTRLHSEEIADLDVEIRRRRSDKMIVI